MKKHITIFVFLTTTLFGFARNLPIVVSGKWEHTGEATEIALYKVTFGRLEKVSVALLKNDRSFGMSYVPQTEGFFVIGTEDPDDQRRKYTFYFKPGDNLYFSANNQYYTLTGEHNSRENIVLKSWHDFVSNFEAHSTESFQPTRTGNRVFDQSFAKYREFNLMEYQGIPSDYDLTAETDLFIFPRGINLLMNSLTDKTTIEDAINATQNDTLKGEVFLSMLAVVKQLPEMQDLGRRYAQYILTDDQKARFDREIERINRLHIEMGVGASGLDFTYKDANGNDVSFSDFRGKFVYIDVWATWCTPCLAEIPHFKNLEKQFANNDNIVFVGISTDHLRDIHRWKNFIANHNLGIHGDIQLHGNVDGPTNISKLYGIIGIPHYLLFDKNGNIVSTDAPRPSSAEIVPMLNRLLR